MVGVTGCTTFVGTGLIFVECNARWDLLVFCSPLPPLLLIECLGPTHYSFDTGVEQIPQKLVQGVIGQTDAHDGALPVPPASSVGQQQPHHLGSHKRLPRSRHGHANDVSRWATRFCQVSKTTDKLLWFELPHEVSSMKVVQVFICEINACEKMKSSL